MVFNRLNSVKRRCELKCAENGIKSCYPWRFRCHLDLQKAPVWEIELTK